MEKMHFAEDEIIFRQGECTTQLFVIEQGSVYIYRNYGRTNQRLLAELTIGNSFSETAVVSNHPRSVTAVTHGAVDLTAYSKEDFGQLIVDYPEMALNIIRELSERLRNTTDQLMAACQTISESINEKVLIENKGLFVKLKKFANIYDEACRENYDNCTTDSTAKAVTAYNNFGPVTKR